MGKLNAGNQIVSVNVINGSTSAIIVILAVVSMLFLIVLGAFSYGVSRLKPRRRYKRIFTILNVALAGSAALSLTFGIVALAMGSADDAKTLNAFNAQVKSQMGYDVVFLSKDLQEYFVTESHDNIGKTYHNVLLNKDGRTINCDMRNITTGVNSDTLKYFFTCGHKR